MSIGAEVGRFVVQHTIQKKNSENSMAVESP